MIFKEKILYYLIIKINCKIIKVYHNIQANDRGLFSSVTPAKYAVECAAGDATRLGLKVGKRIRIFGHPPNVD